MTGLLQALINDLRYKPGWRFGLEPALHMGGCDYVLIVTIDTTDSTDPKRTVTVTHRMGVPPVPVEGYDFGEEWWRRWLFDRILDVERHEAGEFFRFGDERPFFPQHGGALVNGTIFPNVVFA